MGLARFAGAVIFAIVVGWLMSVIFKKEEKIRQEEQMNLPEPEESRPLWQTASHFFILVLILVFANWGRPDEGMTSGTWYWIWSNKWVITSVFGLLLAGSLVLFLKMNAWQVAGISLATAGAALLSSSPMIPVLTGIAGLSLITLLDRKNPENREWTFASWDFAKQILPLLAAGVLLAGFLLGSSHGDTNIPGIIPEKWISLLVGGDSFFSNLFASVVGAFMYFATLTEIPILQGLMAAGMGKGPALALLLAGPSLSLPNMLVIRGVLGTRKTLVYVCLVVVMATLSGLIYGQF